MALALPWLTWARLSAQPALADELLAIFQLGGLLLIALIVGRGDRWLGCFVALSAGTAVFHARSAYGLEMATIVAVGALGVWAVRELPIAARDWVTTILPWSALPLVIYAVMERLGFDPLHSSGDTVLGSTNFLGAYLAILAPLAPWPLLLAIGVGLVLSHSLAAMAAAAVGLAIRYRDRPWLLAGVIPVAALVIWQRGAHLSSAWERLSMAGLALEDVGLSVLGFGPGSWFGRMVGVQLAHKVTPLYLQAHNEYLQAYYEGGLVALALIAMWLVSHRKHFLMPAGACVVALAVDSLAMFPLHVPTIAAIAIVLVGLATAEPA